MGQPMPNWHSKREAVMVLQILAAEELSTLRSLLETRQWSQVAVLVLSMYLLPAIIVHCLYYKESNNNTKFIS